ncbi:MAG: sigma-70 family RNA polymerase sigma factor [Verrucomicrobia bacterium]|nr:sigma-70 family RNA polymerase sigma factor [Verrucomicrobiota bacterium]
MPDSDSELLRRHLQGSDPTAFEHLVRRHLPLVLGVAHRHLDEDSSEAEDVAQEVFLRLARQAKELAQHPSLAGWCFQTARHVVLNHRRARVRQRQRELASASGPLAPETEPAWEEFRPELDRALESLPSPDRELVLWRFFEKARHAEIGHRLGIQENAARMRVERALEKLRENLQQRGIPSTAAALGLVLGQHAVASPPAGWVERIALRATAPAAVATVGGGLLAWLLHPTRVAVGLALVSGLTWWNLSDRNPKATRSEDSPRAAINLVGQNESEGLAPSNQGTATVASAPDADTTGLRLTIRNPQQSPVTNTLLRVVRMGSRSGQNEVLTNDTRGFVWIPYATNLSVLEIQTEREGYADVRLSWKLSEGELPPAEYVLELQPGILLGGRVLDTEESPIAGAQIQIIQYNERGTDRQGPRSFLPRVKVETDASGHWQTRRVAESALNGLHFQASHAEFGNYGNKLPLRNPEENAQLREARWEVRLTPSMTAGGIVVDPEGQPVADAMVSTTSEPSTCSNCPETRTDEDGRFLLNGIQPGHSGLFVLGNGYPLTPFALNATNLMDHRIVLMPGRTVKLRVVGPEQTPVTGAFVYLQTGEPPDYVPGGIRKSDTNGWVVWTNAPTSALSVNGYATGYERFSMTIDTSKAEQTLELNPARTFHGTVTDAATGNNISSFSVEAGLYRDLSPMGTWHILWPPQQPKQFRNGHYQLVLEEFRQAGESYEHVLRCLAPGYAPSFSARIPSNAPGAEIHFQLHRLEPLERWVVDTDGNPVPGATVAPLTARSQVAFANGQFHVRNSDDELLKTDVAGRVTLPFHPGIERVAIAAPQGFALLSARDLRAQSTLTLERWGRIEGHLSAVSETPVSFIALSDGQSLGLVPNHGQMDSEASVDSQGNFSFTQVPPGQHALFLGYRQGNSQRTSFFQRVVSTSSETNRLQVTSPRRTVLARVVWPDSMPEAQRLRSFARLTEAPFVDAPTGRFRSHHRIIGAKIESDGSARFLEVPAGEYRLSVHLYGTNSLPPFARLALSPALVVVPPEPSETPLDAGTLEVTP